MKNNKDYININYIESVKSREWMNKNLAPKGKSPFIRDAVEQRIERIEKVKLDKKRVSKSKI